MALRPERPTWSCGNGTSDKTRTVPAMYWGNSLAGLALRNGLVPAEYGRSRKRGLTCPQPKSPRKTATKKSGKSLKEKRQAKKDKEQTRKEFGR